MEQAGFRSAFGRDGGRRLGFLHQGALGDFVLFLPVLDALYRREGVPAFHLWTRPIYGSLLEEKPYEVHVHALSGPFWDALYHEEAWKTVPVPEELKGVEAFFWMGQSGARDLVARLRERLSVPVHWIRSFPAEDDGALPVAAFIAKQLSAALGRPVDPGLPEVTPSREAREAVRTWLEFQGLEPKGYGVVHVGSGGRAKVWPFPRWERLLSRLHEAAGTPLVFTTGPADEPYEPFVDRMASKFNGRRVSDFDLGRLAALLAWARFYAGCDSGVSHLTAAVGTPSLVIFGPTDPRVWAPQGPHVQILRDHWGPEDVMDRDARSEAPPPDALPEECRRFFRNIASAPQQPGASLR
ncbi:ADP-heptose:LPS heptosyltransferase [Desulfacinum infernum DSM 9756]|uniref:ADP-heptose:LPS heptosyltransferase n=1 Tax=Desulfacinum infernum DSM 9756 TaxID=1121391 RepID=A0A1M5J9M7_9BACT|nr:glycosyltransferase family 9 protein [Desulfacinum infernum]SHG36713.1 ADP-heptose:LPS heptosyltransferase [Desulfacinum infernum DSM 9756]